jgi:acyl-coenzyme A thioesterase PaaI-like protein
MPPALPRSASAYTPLRCAAGSPSSCPPPWRDYRQGPVPPIARWRRAPRPGMLWHAGGRPMQEDPKPAPRGELAVRTLAMPADTNPAGDIFGGWIMSLMDVAGGITAAARAGGRVVTVSATDMAFLRPVKVGDVVCCYCDPARTGRTSFTRPGAYRAHFLHPACRGLGAAPGPGGAHQGDLGRHHLCGTGRGRAAAAHRRRAAGPFLTDAVWDKRGRTSAPEDPRTA